MAVPALIFPIRQISKVRPKQVCWVYSFIDYGLTKELDCSQSLGFVAAMYANKTKLHPVHVNSQQTHMAIYAGFNIYHVGQAMSTLICDC